MKTLTRLEKSKSFWFLLCICFVFFLLRLPSLIEPYWYGDEGIYQVIGKAINSGRILYSEIWDNKPPLLYIIYAVFHSNQELIRLTSLIVGLFSIVVFFFLSQKLFEKLSIIIVTTSLFAILFATPYMEGNIANAENFMLLPIITAGFLIYSLSEKKKLSIVNSQLSFAAVGLLLGIAFLFKVVAVFDLTAFLTFFLMINASHNARLLKKHNFQKLLSHPLLLNVYFLLLGASIPFLISLLYFASQNALPAYFSSAFLGNISYVDYNNRFMGIPQGILIFKTLLLTAVLSLIVIKRKYFSKPTLFILLWLSFSFFSAFFSQRPYTHYVLIALPSIVLFLGLILTITKRKIQLILVLLLAFLIFIIQANFYFYGFQKTIQYYQNALLFLTGQRDTPAYQAFFDTRTPRDYALATIIKKKLSPSDTVFIWGDSPQIYVLSDTLPPGKFTVSYHISNNQQSLEETQNVLLQEKPKYIISLSEVPVIPFRMVEYHIQFALDKTIIYERNF